VKLNSVTIQNIRSYENQSIEFPLGTSLFEGDIGSGKSTILMAIEFALFGLGSQRGASLLRLGEKKGSVSLSFSVNGQDYEITRKLERGKTSVSQKEGYIVTPQGTIPLSPAELKERILEILNFKEPADPKAQSVIYRYAVYTPQEEMKIILTRTPKERIQTLRKAFGVEDYKTASDNASELASHIKGSKNKLEGQIKDLDAKRIEIETNEREYNQLVERHRKIEEDKKKIDSLQQNDRKKLDDLRKKEQQYNEANTKIPLIESQIKEKRTEMDEFQNNQGELQREIDDELNPQIQELLKKSKPTNKTKEKLKQEITTLRKHEKRKNELLGRKPDILKAINRLEKKLGVYKDKSPEEIEKEIKSDEKEVLEINSNLKSIEEQLKQVRKQKAEAEVKQAELKEKIDELKGVKGQCPVCERELSDAHKKHLKEERDAKLNEIITQLPILEKNEKGLEEEKENSENQRDEINERISKLKKLQENSQDLGEELQELSSIEEEIKKIDSSLMIKEEAGLKGLSDYENPSDYLQAVLDELTEYLSSRDKIDGLKKHIVKNQRQIGKLEKQIVNAKNAIEKLEKNIKSLQNTVNELKEIPSKVEAAERSIQSHENTLKNLEKQSGENEGRMLELKASKDRLEVEIKEKEKAKILLDKFQDYYIWLTEYLIPMFQVIERQVMIAIKQEFESYFQKWYSMLLDEPDKDARIDEDFTPLVEQDGYEQEIDYLSGGERTSLALAYRLALNTIVQKVSTGMRSNLIILDEPTDGFSKSQLFKVRDVLKELNCPQVIMVSHETELENFANKIFQITKSNGVSTIVSR